MATRVASSDRRVVEVLGAGRLLGAGGEARVHELDSEHVARVHRQGASLDRARERASLLAEIGRHAGRVPFEIPSVVEIREVEGRLVSIETRLPGRAMGAVLAELRGEPRSTLIASYMEAAARVGDLEVDRPWFGELISAKPTRCPSFRSWLFERADESLRACDLGGVIDAAALAAALPEPAQGTLVHLDFFPGNVLVEGERITAVLDFSVLSIRGDRRLDPLTAAAYLAPEITPGAGPEDRASADEWLASHGLAELSLPAERWLAAFWSAAEEPERIRRWTRRILLDSRFDSPLDSQGR